MDFKEEVSLWFGELQFKICQDIKDIDGQGEFIFENWNRPEGGGGKSSHIQNSSLFEKAGINYSAVHGPLPKSLELAFHMKDVQFYATGVSIVMHPHNPWIPIIHMNVRYFEMDGGRSWFGGGIDLTPHFIMEEDAQYFHQELKTICDEFNKDYYPRFKKWADDYFFIAHRNETRGIGGIFFDRLEPQSIHERDILYQFVKKLGSSFPKIYAYFLKKYRNLEFSESEKNWQYQRRGRYVEFNLVYDAGTKFGLETQGRIESILMSLPPMASWKIDQPILPESKEAHTLSLLKKGIDWV